MKRILVAALLMTSTSVEAQQPIHESLVECSVLVDLMIGEQSKPKDQYEMVDFYVDASRIFRQAAVERSNTAYVTKTSVEKRLVWHQRWDAGQWDDPANRGDLVQWWTYCFKLADHLKLPEPRV